jgi:hypothetical protein
VTAWSDYLTAAQRLDASRREATTALAAQTATVKAAQQELAVVRQRLSLQQARLTDIATRAHIPLPPLTPDPAVPDPPDPAAATALLRAAVTDLDAADAELSEVDTGTVTRGPFPDLPQTLRNLIVYGAAAVLVLIGWLILFLVSSGPVGGFVGLVCGATLPAFAFGASWLTVGLLYGKVDRTPVIGAAVSAAPFVLFCGWTVVAAVLR